jgi:sec-independent protein translocase protein TatC
MMASNPVTRFFRKQSSNEMPFLDHLEELRWRLIWSLATVLVCAIAGYFIVERYDVLGLLTEPVEPYLNGGKLNYTSPTFPFFITLKLGIITGLLIAAPVVVYHVWAFLSPALMPAEKRAIIPALYFGLVLFAAGVAMAYYLVLPATLRFTMSFQVESLEEDLNAQDYLSLVVRLLLAFGVVFEMPVVILALSALGIVTPEFLAEKRRYAIAAITVLSAVLTPGDVITVTIMMMVPLVLLYELSIVLSRVVTRKRLAATASAEG